MRADLVRLTRNYLGFQVSFALLFWLPVFYEVQRRLGISDSGIFEIQSFYYLFFCVLELPTGWLADRFGSIRTLRAGALVLVGAHLVVLVHPGWIAADAAFLYHFALIALARSLVSGASNAYLFEAYEEAGLRAEYVHVEGRARAYGLMAKIICWSFVGYLMEWSLLSSYWLTLGSAGAACFYGFSLRERRNAAAGRAEGTPHVGHAILALRREPALLGLMVQGMGVFVLARIVQVNLFQPLLLSRGFPAAALGWVMALMTVFEAAASLKLRPVLARIDAARSVSLLSGLTALSVSALALPVGRATVPLLLLFSAALGLAGPIQRQVINQGISASSEGPRIRATLLSLESLLDRAVCSLVVAGMGPWVESGRMDVVFLVSGAAFLVIATFQLFRQAKRPDDRA
jgi:hypothetical protein